MTVRNFCGVESGVLLRSDVISGVDICNAWLLVEKGLSWHAQATTGRTLGRASKDVRGAGQNTPFRVGEPTNTAIALPVLRCAAKHR